MIIDKDKLNTAHHTIRVNEYNTFQLDEGSLESSFNRNDIWSLSYALEIIAP